MQQDASDVKWSCQKDDSRVDPKWLSSFCMQQTERTYVCRLTSRNLSYFVVNPIDVKPNNFRYIIFFASMLNLKLSIFSHENFAISQYFH